MKNYLLGILGGLVCGLVASLPWLLIYIYGNMIFSLLAIPIALGVDFGYRKFKGKVDKHLSLIVSTISIFIIIMLCLIIIPLALLAKEGYLVSLSNLKILYESKEFMGAIVQDLLISIAFAALGIAGVIKKIKAEVNS